MTDDAARVLVENLLTFVEKVSRRKLEFSLIVDRNGQTENPTDRMVLAVSAALRAAEARTWRAAAHVALKMFISVDPMGRMSRPQRHKWEAGRKIAAALDAEAERQEGS